MAFGHFLLGSHNFHGHGSWLVCEMALTWTRVNLKFLYIPILEIPILLQTNSNSTSPQGLKVLDCQTQTQYWPKFMNHPICNHFKIEIQTSFMFFLELNVQYKTRVHMRSIFYLYTHTYFQVTLMIFTDVSPKKPSHCKKNEKSKI